MAAFGLPRNGLVVRFLPPPAENDSVLVEALSYEWDRTLSPVIIWVREGLCVVELSLWLSLQIYLCECVDGLQIFLIYSPPPNRLFYFHHDKKSCFTSLTEITTFSFNSSQEKS